MKVFKIMKIIFNLITLLGTVTIITGMVVYMAVEPKLKSFKLSKVIVWPNSPR